MERAYRFRIYPSPSQEVAIQRTFGCARYVYNYYLTKRKNVYANEKINFNYYACMSDLTNLKKELNWLKEPDKFALQNALRDLERAYQNFFRHVKNGESPGFPTFKTKKGGKRSYTTTFTNDNIKILDKCIQLPKLGLIKCHISKVIDGRILSATVSQVPSGKYFVSIICTDVEIKPFESTGAMAGIDLGIKELCITSDGEHIPNPKNLYKFQKKLVRLQRQLSRKSKGSNNREKARIKVARLYEHITNQRRDAQHKMTTQLVRDYDLLCTESLRIKNMLKNHRLAKAIGDAAWGGDHSATEVQDSVVRQSISQG